MNRQELDHWFELRFPRDLEQEQVLAALSALSGLPHRARLMLELSANQARITHRLALNEAAHEAVSGALRAAIPSLRLLSIDPPAPAGSRVLWQLSPKVAALRSDTLPASAAALLSSFFPLQEDEAVSLRWQLRPAMRPVLPPPREREHDGRLKALRAKLALPGLAAVGELFVSAPDAARRNELFQRTASALRSLATPHGRLVAEPRWLALLARLVGRRGRYFSAAELAAVIGWPMDEPGLPGLSLGAAKRLAPAIDLTRGGRLLGTSDFSGLNRPIALAPKASTKGLYILGPTGTGKTSLLKNLVANDLAAGRGLAVVETNGDLIAELADSINEQRIADVVLLDPTDPECAVGFNPFASQADPSLIADQLGELFQRLWSAFWGPRTAQLTHMGLLTLARRQDSTLLDLPRLYLDEAFRARVLDGLDDPLGLGPDWQWFSRLSQGEQTTVVSPLLNKTRQFVARPAIRAIVGQARPKVTMRQIIEEKKVLLVHLPKGLIGAETAQLLGCLVLTSIWQAMAERTALRPDQRHPFSLYVDEVQDFASAPLPWDEMLAQGRKYGLSLTIAHQNLEQLPREIREVVLANARSKVAFSLSAKDARTLEPLFAPALTAADLQALDPYSVAALVALDDGSVAPPVTLTTPPPLDALGSSQAVRASSRRRYGRARTDLEAELRAGVERAPAAPVRRKRRAS